MGPIGRNCASCVWWQRQGPQLSKAVRDPSSPPSQGTCQVHAPVVVQSTGAFPVSMFPVTHEARSCGDWQGRGEGGGPDGGETVVPFPTSRIAA
jgi:hypothetical protein